MVRPTFNWDHAKCELFTSSRLVSTQSIFFSSFLSRTQGRKKEKAYSDQHSSARKAAERVFGAPFRLFKILYYPCRLEDKKDMLVVVEACSILHNMNTLELGYERTVKLRKQMQKDGKINSRIKRFMRVECIIEECRRRREKYVYGEKRNAHCAFKKSVIEHISSQASVE